MKRHIQSLLLRFVKRWELNNLFCIISAIGNDYGIFTYQERFQQLLESIESVKKYAPNSDIILVDASENSLSQFDVNILKNQVNHLIFIHEDKYIQFLKYHSKDPSPNKFEKKTVGEIQAMLAFLNFMKSHFKSYNRVFKLAGRYKLNENFKLENFNKSNKCVFKEKENWYDEYVFTIRLWSFDYKDLAQISKLFDKIQEHTYNLVTQSKNLEVIEFTLTDFIEEWKIPYETIEKIGLCGLSGQNATVIDE